MTRSSYQPVYSFGSGDIPLSAQHSTSTSPPPVPQHQGGSDPFQKPHASNNDIELGAYGAGASSRGAYSYHPNEYPHQPPESLPPYTSPPPQRGQPYAMNAMPLHQQQAQHQQHQQPIGQQGPPVQQPYYGPPPVVMAQQQPMGKQRPAWKRALLGPVRVPIFSHLSAVAMLVLLIYELVRNSQLTGSVIQQPNLNPMIGPSFSVLVNIGAKFLPCMRPIPEVTDAQLYSQCFKNTDECTLATMCGFPTQTTVPDQSFRFIVPIFMHAGIVHYIVNMLTHMRLGVDLERTLGTPRYVLLYMGSGIFSFVLSATLNSARSASMGCSGALFGLIGFMFIDVLVNWKVIEHPVRELMWLLVSTIISLVLGLLPGLDNWAHIGGFVTGLVMGMLLSPMRPMATKNIKIITWVCRLIGLVVIIVMFAVGITKFYEYPDPTTICPSCKYISCLPVNGWCDNY
ncbi:hypothetical protein BC940DRAFT_296521 [Gongronella butleri]|nr:hypothetical protein BC940DRAFT_296521 [Gongronella butleri]